MESFHEERKFCPQCAALGQKSVVTPGSLARTAAYHPPFYDEGGRWHHHDANVTTQVFSCGRGHAWQEERSGSCWCGWPKNQEKP